VVEEPPPDLVSVAEPVSEEFQVTEEVYARTFEELEQRIREWNALIARKDYDAVLDYLAGETRGLDARRVYGKIALDRAAGTFRKRGRLARLIYLTNVGTIPDEANVRVKVGGGMIGTITEDFSERLKPGDVFVLGGEAYEFLYSRGMAAQVRPSAGRLPTVPSWISESLPLNHDLALEIQAFRSYLAQLLEGGKNDAQVADWVRSFLPVDEAAVRAIVAYAREQHRYSLIPHARRILIEQFRDGNKKHVIVHGAWGLVLGRMTGRTLLEAKGYDAASYEQRGDRQYQLS